MPRPPVGVVAATVVLLLSAVAVGVSVQKQDFRGSLPCVLGDGLSVGGFCVTIP